ncbi:MAG: hypothetical protein ACTHMC_10065 [Pseudobacter sp.]|uniref:hypothetical protein n=1 Tax=Pseudobacter sp. TaxID=2045420 RepID=UPI003F80FAF7
MGKGSKSKKSKSLAAKGNPVVEITQEVVVNDQPAQLSDKEKEEIHREELKKFEEGMSALKEFRKELLEVFRKSQDTFDKQLSYIAAGSLALSIGFIKDIVKPIKDSQYKWMLVAGWGALILTLLVNLVSYMIAAKHAKKGANETEEENVNDKYDPTKIDKRSFWIEFMNWSTVVTLTLGILLIVLYIILNALYV